MRRTVKDVEFYLDRVNTVLKEKGIDVVYTLGQRYGYKAIDECFLVRDMNGDFYSQFKGSVRTGLTTGEAYDIAYCMYQLAMIL